MFEKFKKNLKETKDYFIQSCKEYKRDFNKYRLMQIILLIFIVGGFSYLFGYYADHNIRTPVTDFLLGTGLYMFSIIGLLVYCNKVIWYFEGREIKKKCVN